MAFSRSSWLRRRIYCVRNCGNVGVRYALYLRWQEAGKQQAQSRGNQSVQGIGKENEVRGREGSGWRDQQWRWGFLWQCDKGESTVAMDMEIRSLWGQWRQSAALLNLVWGD